MQTGQEVAIKKVRLVQAKEVCWQQKAPEYRKNAVARQITSLACLLYQSYRASLMTSTYREFPVQGIHVTALREIKVLKELHHPHVIELVDVFISSSQNLSIVLELMESDLEAVIKDSSLVLSPADVKSYMQMALKGLEACHAHKVVHRDIKPNNLLTAKSGAACRTVHEQATLNRHGTTTGAAPCRTTEACRLWPCKDLWQPSWVPHISSVCKVVSCTRVIVGVNELWPSCRCLGYGLRFCRTHAPTTMVCGRV